MSNDNFDWKKYLIVFLITLGLFFTAIYLSNYFGNQKINQLKTIQDKIAIDIPSGLFCDKPNSPDDAVIHSNITFTFHAPKLSFLFAANGKYVPEFKVLDIGLLKEYEAQLSSSLFYVTHDFTKSWVT